MVGSMRRQDPRGDGTSACRTTFAAPTAAARASTSSASAAPISARRRTRSRSPAIPSEPDVQGRRTWLCSTELEDRLDDRGSLLKRLDTLPPRRRSQRHDGGDGQVQPPGGRTGDQRSGPQGVRPVAGAAKRPRDATACTLGASGPYWPAGWSKPARSFVTMVMENPCARRGNADGRGLQLGLARRELPHLRPTSSCGCRYYDQAVTALIEDLYARGLESRCCWSSPASSAARRGSNYARRHAPGRDHWPQAMSMLVSGGGMRTGQVDRLDQRQGRSPKDRPLTPNDLWATVLAHLGIDHGTPSSITTAGRCRSFPSATRSGNSRSGYRNPARSLHERWGLPPLCSRGFSGGEPHRSFLMTFPRPRSVGRGACDPTDLASVGEP